MTARWLSILIGIVMTMVSGVAQGASFHAGDALIDAQERVILGVSANGSTATGDAFVVGQSLDPNTGELAYRWTQDGGFQPLGKLPQQTVLGGFAGQATSTWSHASNSGAISADGLTIVGTSSVGFDLAHGRDWASQAFRWTEQAGMVPLGVLPGYEYSQALDVSRDGGVIVGFGEHVDANVTESDAPHWLTSLALTPFRWTETHGLQPLVLPAGFDRGIATDVSSDGKVIAGVLQTDKAAESFAFRWTEQAGIQALSADFSSAVWDTSADGSVIVGQVWEPQNASVTQAFRWTQDGGMQLLTEMGAGMSSLASAVSADGSQVLGSYRTDEGFQAFLWDDARGLRPLQDVLASQYGLDASLAGWQLFSVRGISEDGTVIHGIGETPDGLLDDWIAFLDSPLSFGPLPGDFDHSGVVDASDIDLLAAAVRSASTGSIFDLDLSGSTDQSDLDMLIHDVLGTFYGDANLDGEFNSLDIVAVFQTGKYEDAEPLNADWASGDWDHDQDFTTSDLVAAFQDGGYEQGPRSAIRASVVPEPVGGMLMLLAVPWLMGCRRCL